MATTRSAPPPRTGTPRVALLVETSNTYGRGLLAGVAEYVQAFGPWSIYLPDASVSAVAAQIGVGGRRST